AALFIIITRSLGIFKLLSKIEERRISQRLKQINIAKNSVGYQRYTTAVRKNERKRELSFTWHPSTPDPYSNTSKSCFSGRLKEWKLRLHLWGNLDDLEYSNLIQNNLKFPPGANSNPFSKVNYFENILDNGNDNTNESSLKFIRFSELRISPISFSGQNSLIKTNRGERISKSDSLVNSIKLSRKILLPKVMDCEKSHDIMKYITLFIPDNYKGMLIWKSTNFIRHCDIILTAHKHRLKILKHGLSLFEFNKRYNIDVSGLAHNSNNFLKDIQISISGIDSNSNKLCKLSDKPYKNICTLISHQKMISHFSKKVVLTQNKLFGFREQDVFKLSFAYHPSSIIYYKILEKLHKS
ncbi:SLBP family of RNA binding proteins, partial [Cryptosporidium parvum Iowa II]